MRARVRVPGWTWVRFGLVGVLNTLAGLLVIYVLKYVFATPDVAANLVGYAVGLTTSYTLNRRWTFAFRGPHRGAISRFILVTIVAYGANLALVCAALYLVAVNSYVAQAVGVIPYALISYLGSRFFAFPAPSAEPLAAMVRPENGQ
jgi:putative flippase GtrA